MALDVGRLVGGIIAGGLAGGGEAAQKSMASAQDAQQREDLVKMQSQLDEQKQLRIVEATQAGQMKMQQAGFAHDDSTLATTQAFTGTQNDLTRANQKDISAANNATTLAATGMHVNATLEAERMRIGAAKAAADKPVLIQTETGPMMVDPKSAIATAINGADGKPIGGMKMSQIDSVAFAAAQKLALDPMAEKETIAAANAKMEAIAAKYSPGGVAPGSTSAVKIPPAAAALLKKDPSLRSSFEAKYGAGSADSILGGDTPKAASKTSNPFSTGTPGVAPLPGGGDPSPGMNRAPLIAGNLPPQQSVPGDDAQLAATTAALKQRNTLPAPRVTAPVAVPPVAAAAPSGALPQRQGLVNLNMGTSVQGGIVPGQGPVDAYGRPIIQNQFGQ